LFAPYGEPLPGVSAEARASFDRGRSVARRRFVPSNGLGPSYNAVSCGGCHEKPVTGGAASRYRGVFVTQDPKPNFIVPFEQHFTTDSVPQGTSPTATRKPNPFFGAGLLAEISPEEIASHSDPSDSDGDGIHGKVNFERGFVGRFGRKAQMSSTQGFVRLALLDHMGLTTTPVKTAFIAEPEGPVELPTVDGDGVADPELGQEDLADLLAFVSLLAPPPPDPPNAETRAGESLFRSVGCASCHLPSLQGPRGPVFAYTDLLLHDMGPALADGVAVGEAGASDFRTQPLWGLAAVGPYLHDGRADTIDEAIRAHGGEATASEQKYEALAAPDRDHLLAFLHSLGGADRRPDGLLPRDAPLPAPGEIGGPAAPLAPPDVERFTRGRDRFDHDFTTAEGLGPRFNGDACRSCHFDPVLGGAGPPDVDVVRYGFSQGSGTFVPPAGGNTMASRFDISRVRPPTDQGANLFERRQTPALFGLGLIEAIDDEVLRAQADPDDKDGDGIRGALSTLPDGRIGRFGWKGQAATLMDFTLDALENELGLKATTATVPGELAADDVGDLVFFLQQLAPPRGSATPVSEVFTRFECHRCHTPELPTRDGRAVHLFSDLLLHDVAPKETRFVLQGVERGFRTPPLWGVSATAPFFHDGMAETLDAAIRRHDGEASRSRDAYVQASDSDRRALLDFLDAL
jgi:CxxC motif-containing protein (DUF1111 family)